AGSSGGSAEGGKGGATGAAGGSPTAGSSGTADEGGAPSCVPNGAEKCDGADNDCNDVIDDGCPQGINTVFESELATIGDSPGGSAFSEDCGEGEILTGVQVAMGPFLTQVQGICRKLGVALTTNAMGYDVALGAEAMLAPYPATTKDATTAMKCGANEAVVGVGVAQQNLQSDTGTFVIIPEVWLSCAKLSLVPSGDDDYYLDWQDAYDLDSVFGTMSDNSSWYEYSEVPTGQVATRLLGASGAWLDRLGFGVSNTLVTLVR
ncbi:MAG TPA: hypothetical protein VEQ59_20240, partial [Polyangiaceae bacterium]|nr:hypothetical protein [Polyangiaceae bacterium]